MRGASSLPTQPPPRDRGRQRILSYRYYSAKDYSQDLTGTSRTSNRHERGD